MIARLARNAARFTTNAIIIASVLLVLLTGGAAIRLTRGRRR